MVFLQKSKSIILIAFVLVFLLQPQSMADEPFIRVWGHGYGHGVGMCQYGAYGMAKQGKNHEQILKYYFTGVTLKKYLSADPTVKVLIIESSSNVILAGSPGISILNEKSGAYVLKDFSNKVKIELVKSGDTYLFKVSKFENNQYVSLGTFTGPLKITASSFLSYFEGSKKYDYKGYFRCMVNTTKGTFLLINFVGLETYVYGIAEMPSSWSIEALKAQAIAARTYAFSRIKSTNTYDLTDDQSSQVYVGLNKINDYYGSQWKKACDETSKTLIYYGDRVASVYYHSTCGGHTENSEDVWVTAYPENRGVVCSYCSFSPYYNWETTVSIDSIRKAFNDPSIVYAQVYSRIAGRRVDRVYLFKSNGQILNVSGSTFRSKLGLKSTWFYLSAERIAGKDRYETNEMASKKVFTSAGACIVASGENYADGLSSSSLAGSLNAPILLTSASELKITAQNELKRLNPGRVYLIGGYGALSLSVEKKIKEILPYATIVRLAGANRYETNEKVNEELLTRNNYSKTCFVVYGQNFPDAISVSPLAFRLKAPLVLTNGENLNVQLIMKLKENGVEKAIIIGGLGVIKVSVENQLKSVFGAENVLRWAGLDRYETAYVVAKNSLSFSFETSKCALANGENFPDALSSSFFCGSNSAVLLLTPSNSGSSWAVKFVKEYKPFIRYIFGGEGAVSLESEKDVFSY